MTATVTSLDRAIADEERHVGIPTDAPLTTHLIKLRRMQIAVMLSACATLAIVAAFFAVGELQILSIALAGFFAIYAIEKDRHLRRLALLQGDSLRITLVVAGELMHTGALALDRELFDLREAIGRGAGRLASGLIDVVRADCARVRLVGPSGEVPIAAQFDVAAHRPVPIDEDVARTALRERAPQRKVSADGPGVLVVPMWRGKDVVGLLEAVAPGGVRYTTNDVALVDAYARGAIGALLTPPPAS
jgi:hypothetical protein